MKKLFSLLFVLFVAISTIFAQIPESLKWQGVVRGADGQVLSNKSVSVTVDIVQSSSNVVFTETFQKTTSQTGQVDILIGSTKSISDINWSFNTSFRVYIDGTKVTETQFSSVPYAMKAKNAETVNNVYLKNILDFPKIFDGNYGSLNNKPDLSKFLTTVGWSDITGKPNLFDGKYSSLTGVPTLFNGDYKTLTNQPNLNKFLTTVYWDSIKSKPTVFNSDYNTLLNKPNLFDGKYSSLTGVPTLFNGDYNTLLNKPDLTKFLTSVGWSNITGKPALFNGDYNTLTNKPDLSKFVTTIYWDSIKSKPTLFNGDYKNLVNKPDLSKFLTAEVEPIYKTSVASTISTVDIAKWNSIVSTDATKTTHGLMSKLDKNKLDSLIIPKYSVGDSMVLDYTCHLEDPNRYMAFRSTFYVFRVDKDGHGLAATYNSSFQPLWCSYTTTNMVVNKLKNSFSGEENQKYFDKYQTDYPTVPFKNSVIGIVNPGYSMWVTSCSEIQEIFASPIVSKLGVDLVNMFWTSNFVNDTYWNNYSVGTRIDYGIAYAPRPTYYKYVISQQGMILYDPKSRLPIILIHKF